MYLMHDEPNIVSLTEGFIGWTAGIIDGEGHIRIDCHRHNTYAKTKTFSMYVRVGNTDPSMVLTLCSAWGGSFRHDREKTTNRADVYVWTILSKQARHLLETIEPFLVTKRSIARLCIDFQKRQSEKIGLTLRTASNRLTLTPEEYAIRTDYVQQVRTFNDKRRKYLNPPSLTVVNGVA